LERSGMRALLIGYCVVMVIIILASDRLLAWALS
jgi:hypothetical protein